MGLAYRVAAVVLLVGVWFSCPDAVRSAGPPTIAVVGDSLADGMWSGLQRQASRAKSFVAYRGAKNSVGFTGSDLTDMVDRAFAHGGDVRAVMMMIGTNDRRSFFVDGRPKALFRTPTWLELYKGRVERFMDHVAKRKVPLVWVLLPVMRDAEATRDAELINGIVTEAAKTRAHVILVETSKLTSDDKGAYQPFFADLKGEKRQMRTSDGVHFEIAAYDVFAVHIMSALRVQEASFAVGSQ